MRCPASWRRWPVLFRSVVPASDALGGKPIPKVAQLSKEYAALLAEKQAEYENYKALRQEMINVRTAKQNVDRILGLEQGQAHSTEINR